jgi:hypothetical protein
MTTPPVQERFHHSESLCRFLSHLIDLSQPFIEGDPKITCGFGPVDRLPEEFNWSECLDAPIGPSEEHRGALRDVERNPPLSQPPL